MNSMRAETFRRFRALAAVLAVALALPIAAAEQQAAEQQGAAEAKAGQVPAAKAKIVILATGGTIAGAQPKPGDIGYKAGSVLGRDAHQGGAGDRRTSPRCRASRSPASAART